VLRLFAALAVAALVCGCGAVHPLTSSQSTVPWLPLPADLTPLPVASPLPVPVSRGTPTCLLSDLEGAVIGSNGATGHVLTVFAFATSSAQACQVNGTPVVTLMDGSGGVLGFKNRAPYFPDEVSGPALIEPGPAPIFGLGPKYGEAALTIDWISQPESCPGDAAAKIATARIEIAGVGTVSVGIPAEPPGYACAGVGVGALADPVIPGVTPPEPPVPAPSIVAPAKVKAGDRLTYVVTLSNPTKLPLDLRKQCPNYEEELFADIENGSPPLGGKHLYRLNCEAAGVLKPGAPMSFAMVFDVPADTAPGSYTLAFMIGYGNAMSRFAQTVIAID